MTGIGGHVNRGDRRRRREQPRRPTESERMAWFSAGILRGVRDALPHVRIAWLDWRGRGA